jgi:hypothetical protein
VRRKRIRKGWFDLTNSSFGGGRMNLRLKFTPPKRRFWKEEQKMKIYPSQTKILEGLTKGEIKIFDIHLKGVSTRFGLQTIEKYIENLDFIFCQSFQNLRLGSIKLS